MSDEYRPFGDASQPSVQPPPFPQDVTGGPGVPPPLQPPYTAPQLPTGGIPLSSGKSSGGIACLYGCLIGGALLVLLMIVLGVGAYFAGTKMLSSMVQGYTDDKPAEMPEVALPPAGDTSLSDRVDAFIAALEAGTPVEPLALSAEDINILLRTRDDLKEMGHYVYVTIAEDGTVGGEVSIPLDQFLNGMLGTKGRYINGAATFAISLTQGRFALYLNSLNVKGDAIPEEFMAGIRSQNLAQDFVNNPDAQQWLNKIASISVVNQKIVITPKNALEVPAAEEPPATGPVEETPQAVDSGTT